MKYKAGDKVRCISRAFTMYIQVGAVYTVKRVKGNHLVFEEIELPHAYVDSRFELVESKPKFKAGDKVRCVSQSKAVGVEVGSIYTVKNPQLFESEIYKGVYCMELLEVPSSPYDKHFELVHEDAVLTPEEVFEHLRKGTKLQYRRTAASKWVESITGSKVATNPSFRMITEGHWRIKPEPEVIELNGKKYIEITE